MGIQIEFNPDLALRSFKTPNRLEEECLPNKLMVGNVHRFQKDGQRVYWLDGEIPLLETKGNQKLSRPLASIVIREYTHLKVKDKTYTTGLYEIKEVYDSNDPKIHFEGMNKIT